MQRWTTSSDAAGSGQRRGGKQAAFGSARHLITLDAHIEFDREFDRRSVRGLPLRTVAVDRAVVDVRRLILDRDLPGQHLIVLLDLQYRLQSTYRCVQHDVPRRRCSSRLLLPAVAADSYVETAPWRSRRGSQPNQPCRCMSTPTLIISTHTLACCQSAMCSRDQLVDALRGQATSGPCWRSAVGGSTGQRHRCAGVYSAAMAKMRIGMFAAAVISISLVVGVPAHADAGSDFLAMMSAQGINVGDSPADVELTLSRGEIAKLPPQWHTPQVAGRQVKYSYRMPPHSKPGLCRRCPGEVVSASNSVRCSRGVVGSSHPHVGVLAGRFLTRSAPARSPSLRVRSLDKIAAAARLLAQMGRATARPLLRRTSTLLPAGPGIGFPAMP